MGHRAGARRNQPEPVSVRVAAVLFDLDDTLFDRRGTQGRIAQVLFERFPATFAGLDMTAVVDVFLESDREATREFVAGGAAETVRSGRSRRFLASLGLDGSVADEITAAYLQAYGRVGRPVPGAARVARRLSKDFRLGIVSNGFPDAQYAKLRSLGIAHLFDPVLLSEEVGIRKPDPTIFRRAAEALDRGLNECLFVGDSYETDIVGAKLAGMTACWYNPRGLELPRTDLVPDFVVSRLVELTELVDPPEVEGDTLRRRTERNEAGAVVSADAAESQ